MNVLYDICIKYVYIQYFLLQRITDVKVYNVSRTHVMFYVKHYRNLRIIFI